MTCELKGEAVDHPREVWVVVRTPETDAELAQLRGKRVCTECGKLLRVAGCIVINREKLQRDKKARARATIAEILVSQDQAVAAVCD